MPVKKIFEKREEVTGQRQSIAGISICKGPSIGWSKVQLRSGKKVNTAAGLRAKEEWGQMRPDTQVLLRDLLSILKVMESHCRGFSAG